MFFSEECSGLFEKLDARILQARSSSTKMAPRSLSCLAFAGRAGLSERCLIPYLIRSVANPKYELVFNQQRDYAADRFATGISLAIVDESPPDQSSCPKK